MANIEVGKDDLKGTKTILESGGRRPDDERLRNLSSEKTHSMDAEKMRSQFPVITTEKVSELFEKNEQVYADEFRLNLELYGDANHFGLLVISDSRKATFNPAPQVSIPLDTATPEAIGEAVTEYIRKNCSER